MYTPSPTPLALPGESPGELCGVSTKACAPLFLPGPGRSRVVEIYGPESSGKTTLALQTVAQAQKRGMSCVFVDVEHAIDPAYALKLGVDVDNLLLSQPDTGENALELVDTFVRSGAVDVVVLDSVAALVPRAELEGDMGDHHMALQARLMSQALRKLTSSMGRSNTLIIFINQIRSKVGVIFGSPEVTAGGQSLKYYASVRLDIRRSGQVKQGDEIVASTTRVRVVKNKLAPPFRVAEFDMTYGGGVSRVGELVDLGLRGGFVKRAGAWFSLDIGACRAATGESGPAGPAGAAAAAAPSAGSGSDEEAAPAKRGRAKTVRRSKKAIAEAEADAAAAADAEAALAAAAAADSPATPGEAAAEEPEQLVIGIGQGREKAKAWLEDPANTEQVALLERAIRAEGRKGKLDSLEEEKRKLAAS